MKKPVCRCFIVLAAIISLCTCQQKAHTEKKEQTPNEQMITYTNPVFDKDFADDPAVLKAPDGYYYVYGTNTRLAGNLH